MDQVLKLLKDCLSCGSKLKISRNQTSVKGLFVKISHIDAFFCQSSDFSGHPAKKPLEKGHRNSPPLEKSQT